jgi:hypothetical protein
VDEPIIDYDTPGSEPIIYALSNAGADVLAETFGLPRGTIDWQAKNSELVSKPYIYHTLAVAQVMVQFTADCRERGDIRLLHPRDVVRGTPHATAQQTNPYTWRVVIPGPQRDLRIGLRPDRICGLWMPSRPEGKNRSHLCVEADLGTMPVERDTLRQTSIAKKIIGYSETYKQKLHRDMYGWNAFRVLFVTTSQERVTTMLEYIAKVARERKYPAQLFLFTDFETLAKHNIFELPWRQWRRGREEQVTLLG